MATPAKGMDRRAERTRQMLHQAFIEVIREKGLSAVSVQEIAERANVSRGTFYAHYRDKYALTEAIMREGFQHQIDTMPVTSGWSKSALQHLIRAVLDYFKTVYQHHHKSPEIAPLLEHAIHDELNTVILTWLKQNPSANTAVSLDMLAQIISWGIFGAAVQWSHERADVSADQMAQQILPIILDGVARVIPIPD